MSLPEFVYPPMRAADETVELFARLLSLAILDLRLTEAERSYLLRRVSATAQSMAEGFADEVRLTNAKPQKWGRPKAEAKP